ncbi:MAG: Catabolite control protein A [Verrucomicrobiae bacterium]|nr:Catabolite control protein A [Verrucomicrobiae bacterium]
MTPTLRDIASKAELSISTVSHILNGRPQHYSEKTRHKVERIARRLGYRPNRYAQVMRRQRSGLIGIIQHAGLLQAAVQKANHAALAVVNAGYEPLNADVLWRPAGIQTVCASMLDARVEGVLLVDAPASFPLEELTRFQRAKIPVVALGGGQYRGVPQVRVDARQGMRDLTRHVIALGHRPLCLLTTRCDPATLWPAVERAEGFREACAAAGLAEADAEIIAGGSPNEAMHPYQNGREAMRELLRRERLPRAVLCSNDDWAIGALAACAERGIRVPEEVAVTGFDNSLIGEYCMVPLTTVAQPTALIAREAVAILMQLIAGEAVAPERLLVRVPGQLVVRRSCGAGK